MKDDYLKNSKQSESWYESEKRSRYYIFIIIAQVIIGFSILLFSLKFETEKNMSVFVVFTLLISASLLSLYWYLQIKPIDIDLIYNKDSLSDVDLKVKLEFISEIEDALSIYDRSLINDENREDTIIEIVKYISERVVAFPLNHEFRVFNTDIIVNETKRKLFNVSLRTLKNRLLEEKKCTEENISNKTVEESDKDKSLERMAILIDMSTKRLKEEIAQLSKRANIYIIFGSGITLIGGVFLYFTIQELLEVYTLINEGINKGITTFDIFSVIIRFSIVVFIEVFAFYYLRLYRNIMDNIKFYQNEITNIEMKILSIHTLEGRDCNESLNSLIVELVKTERNFVIDKNKTTIDIEKNKVESDFFKTSTNNFLKLVKLIKS